MSRKSSLTPPRAVAYECIAKVEDLLARADLAEGTIKRSAALASARELAEQCLEANPKDPDCWFIAALAMYNSFAVDETYGSQAEEYLKRTLCLDEKHQFARLYIGHYYYDIGEYQEALSHFYKVEGNYFSSMDQKWRVLKLHELILCGKLNLNHSDVDTNAFSSLFQEYDNEVPEDTPIPLELASTLVKTKESPIWHRVDRNHVLNLFVGLLERKGYTDALQECIATF